MVSCLAVKCTLLGTRHPRKEKETALQNKSVEPACLCGEISVCHEQVAPPAEKRPEPYKAEPERAISKKRTRAASETEHESEKGPKPKKTNIMKGKPAIRK